MTKFAEGGGGFQNNTNGPIEGLEMSHPRRTAEEAAEQAEREANRAQKKAERTAQVERWKNIGKGVLAALALSGATAALILSGKEKMPGESLSQTEWEEAMRKETAGYGANLAYDEDGSSISFVDDRNGVQTHYYFDDIDNDTYIEKGHSSSANGGANFDQSNSDDTVGMTFQGAKSYLDEHAG